MDYRVCRYRQMTPTLTILLTLRMCFMSLSSRLFQLPRRKWSSKRRVIRYFRVLTMLRCEVRAIPTSDLQPYFRRRTELTVHQGCLLWGIRVVIPETLHKDVLNLIHDGHLGVVRMKAMARRHVWWPGIDAEIENCARSCTVCAENRNTPPETPIHPWEYPNRPWQRIHVSDRCRREVEMDWSVRD